MAAPVSFRRQFGSCFWGDQPEAPAKGMLLRRRFRLVSIQPVQNTSTYPGCFFRLKLPTKLGGIYSLEE